MEKVHRIFGYPLGLGHHAAQGPAVVFGPVGIVVLPDDLARPGDFEQAATLRFGDQGVAIGQPLLCTADPAVEVAGSAVPRYCQ